ncbi:MAG: glutamate synthase large subunit [Planctomycetes bacterium]|nr:glutamate synthase large subunit [Planctomycetota bacterium]
MIQRGIQRHRLPGRGSCGIVALAEPKRDASHELIRLALDALACMEHRGGGIADTGDGAGILIRPERSFFERFITPGRRLDPEELLMVGCLYLLPGERNAKHLQREVDLVLRRQGLKPLGWRLVPIRPEVLGARAREDVPVILQVLLGRGHRLEEQLPSVLAFVRRHIEDTMPEVRVPSLSARTTVYKALCTGSQLASFYPDLSDPRLTTRVILGHLRFATNTFSNWHLVQPFRFLAHNGEINTISATTRAVRDVQTPLGVQKVLARRGSDSAQLDRAVELIATERANDLAEALRRLIPPSWREEEDDPHRRRFFEASQRVMGTLGAWEGPAALVASDGNLLVAILDRMGLRPLRWVQERSGRVIVSSEIGAVPIDPAEILSDGQLEPGAMLVADLGSGRLITPEESTDWVIERADQELRFGDLSTTTLLRRPPSGHELGFPVRAQNAFGWTRERVQTLRNMCKAGKEPVHSMGNDRPLAIFSENNSRLYSFLHQIVAVVTNPPIDPLREGQAMDLTVFLGRSPQLDRRGTYRVSPQFKLSSPVLTNADAAAIKAETHPELRAHILDATFTDTGHHEVISDRIQELLGEAEQVVGKREAAVLIISDRAAATDEAGRYPLPALLVASAIHRHLSRTQGALRRDCSLVIETGEVHEGHDLAVLLSYGASAVNPYAMFHLADETPKLEPELARANVLGALRGSLRRIMSKMGISTIHGYRGSALFEAIGLSPQIVDYYLPGTTALLGGLTMQDIHGDVVERCTANSDKLARNRNVSVYRKEVTTALQQVARNGDEQGDYQRVTELLDETPPVYLRDLLNFRSVPAPVELEEVAPADEVIRACFRGAAMSHGALQAVAHRAIAAAFNSFGAMSNSGEGGEDERRNPGGAWEEDRNRVRQVASGRFGVDAAYLVGADELEIKIGQGAKPGEGGHLPGHKVTAEIAAIRKTRPGVDLISPPPHHDIYSIEDLAQLIRHLRAVNPRAAIGVKVPAVTDLGTIAVGIVKAGADTITVSGCTGGTGAAASGSIFHAGVPLERGLSEAHQALVVNGLRQRVTIVADGGIKYGVDVVKILALGADMVGFGTALLVAENCVFCRGCNVGNCPVGLTTHDMGKVFQRFMTRHNKELKKTQVEERREEARDGVRRYLLSVAEHVRRLLSRLGLTHPSELVGRVDLLEQELTNNARWDRLDLSELLEDPRSDSSQACGKTVSSTHEPSPLNARILSEARAALASGDQALIDLGELGQAEHAVGATLAGAIARGELPSGASVEVRARGVAGQGFGFAATQGMSLRLEGYANDVVAEVMGEGASVVVTAPAARHQDDTPHLIGNAAAYGATGGRLYVAGKAGQRFGVRNSGGILIAESVGKYAFEYMTGGVGVVLGPVGHALGSGLTGGEVVVYDPEGQLASRLHPDSVLWTNVPAGRLDHLEDLLKDYAESTGSARAQDLLAGWAENVSDFAWVRSALSDGQTVGDVETEAEEWPEIATPGPALEA